MVFQRRFFKGIVHDLPANAGFRHRSGYITAAVFKSRLGEITKPENFAYEISTKAGFIIASVIDLDGPDKSIIHWVHIQIVINKAMLAENVKIIVGTRAFQRLRQEDCKLFDKLILKKDGKRHLSLTDLQLKDLFNHNCLPQVFAEAYDAAVDGLYKPPLYLLESGRPSTMQSCDEIKAAAREHEAMHEMYQSEAPAIAARPVSGYGDAQVVVLGCGN